jgi:NAD(P)-dependent dehydrogenase (short-subunit alcohol dehydrogenase family)
VADAVQYPSSDAAGFVTGQVTMIDGGRTLFAPRGYRRIDLASPAPVIGRPHAIAG